MSSLRLIDANANRAREALRVMEDAARFELDDADLCARIKSLRHDLAGALAQFERAGMIAWRDTTGDVGTQITTTSESSRATIRDIAAASAKRLTEALRVIEEHAKLTPAASIPQPSPPGRGQGEGSFSPSPPTLEDQKPRTTAATQIKSAHTSESSEGEEERRKSPHPALSQGERVESAASIFESLRYRAYDIEKQLLLALSPSRGVFKGWRLCLLLTESLCEHHTWLDVARLALEAGADCIQLREKELTDRELLARARSLVDVANAHNAAVVINDRPDIARLSGAAGLHLGQTDMPVCDARRIVGFDTLIGVSTSCIEQAKQALRDGADICGVGPMFASATKHKPELADPDYLREYLHHDPPLPPALAISGVTEETLPQLIEAAGGRPFGVAVSSAICAARDPAQATRLLLEAIEHMKKKTTETQRHKESMS
ncbi:MAG: thiamine phosphate synthase [Phycisphaeraceae bacterium]|nr:MAG: thiamine phosphate synthase [Phycisphaeraceae bacterium]